MKLHFAPLQFFNEIFLFCLWGCIDEVWKKNIYWKLLITESTLEYFKSHSIGLGKDLSLA